MYPHDDVSGIHRQTNLSLNICICIINNIVKTSLSVRACFVVLLIHRRFIIKSQFTIRLCLIECIAFETLENSKRN